jgi:glycosyltransferase involved in cell wall biosynthesis
VAPPLVSIVVPCFNQGRYLGEALASAARQTYAPVEVIVVDDGSTDDTRRVASEDAGAIYVHQPNAGTAAARNHGLSLSHGEFVIFLDADDRLLPDAVARGVASLSDRPDAAFVTGHVRLLRADGTPDIVPDQDHEPAGYAALLRWNYIWTPGVVVYRRAPLAAVGGFSAAAGGSADYELNLRIARQHPIGCHHHVVLEYRQHDANMTRDPAYMLRSAVSVRRREKRHAIGRGAGAAWRAGLRAAQADFGARLVDRTKGDLLRGRYGRALRGLACLLRHYPAGLALMRPASAPWTRRQRCGM